MDAGLIQSQVSALHAVCPRVTASHLRMLRDSVEQASCLPARTHWDIKAAAHAEIFSMLADMTDDPVVSKALAAGTAFTYGLLLAAGPVADGMIASSRQRLLAHLGVGDADAGALELEKHLRGLHYLWRLASCSSRGPRPYRAAHDSEPGGVGGVRSGGPNG
jgi:hypothetical protein